MKIEDYDKEYLHTKLSIYKPIKSKNPLDMYWCLGIIDYESKKSMSELIARKPNLKDIKALLDKFYTKIK